MQRILLALPVLFVPVAAQAQDGPSFDCRDATTQTELAICASPDLSQLDRIMVESYERLAAVIGRQEARSIADELLARRQACEGDPACIAERLVISMEVFDQRAGRQGGTEQGGTEFARLEDILPGAPARELPAAPPVVAAPPPVAAAEPPVVTPEPPVVATAEPPVVAEPPPVAADPDLPLAAQAPWPPETEPTGTTDLSDAIDGAELASSDGAVATPAPVGDPEGAAAFDTPLSWAFMDLDREQRTGIQERLVQAGFLQGEAAGSWTNATLAALQTLSEEEGSGSFDLQTQTGASLLLDYIGSEAFASSFGVQQAAATPVATAPTSPVARPPTVVDTVDPLDGADW